MIPTGLSACVSSGGLGWERCPEGDSVNLNIMLYSERCFGPKKRFYRVVIAVSISHNVSGYTPDSQQGCK